MARDPGKLAEQEFVEGWAKAALFAPCPPRLVRRSSTSEGGSAPPVLGSALSSWASTRSGDQATNTVVSAEISINSGASGASGRLLASTSCCTAMLPFSLASTHCQWPLISSADLL